MIYVDYMYYRKKDGTWQDDTKEFTDVESACRFIKKCRYSKGLILDGFRCDDSEDYQYLIMKGC